MVSPDAVRFGVGILGNIIALFLFLSPVPTFINIIKKKSVGQYSPIPYLATFINCMLWVFYGLPFVKPNSTLVVTINGAGVVIELVYLTLFVVYSEGRKKKLKVAGIAAGEVAVVALLAALVLSLAHTTHLRTQVVGMVATVSNVMMYAAPLSVMIPNGLGSLFALAQLILYAAFYKSTKQQIAARKAKEAEIGLSSVVVGQEAHNSRPQNGP